MKKPLLPVVLMLLAGCNYEIPLSQTASSPANPALNGIWIGSSSKDVPTPMEVKISGTDYFVIYGTSSNSLCFKGFEVKANDLNLIQLELQNAETSNKYLFVKYELTPDSLTVYQLNNDVVSAKCQTPEELLADITVHRNNPFLFSEPMKFTRSAPQ